MERRVREELERRGAGGVVVDSLGEALTAAEQPSHSTRLTTLDIRETRPYVGVNVDEPTQLVLGGRIDLGPITPKSPIDFVPEVAFGIGEAARTLLVAANLGIQLRIGRGDHDVRPYVTAGAGFFGRTLLAVNAALGASFDLRSGLDAPRLFVECEESTCTVVTASSSGLPSTGRKGSAPTPMATAHCPCRAAD